MQIREELKARLNSFSIGKVDSIRCMRGDNRTDVVVARNFGTPEFWSFLKALVVDRLELDLKRIEAELYALGVEKDDD